VSGGMVADPAEVRRALGLFADPEAGCELMSLTSGASRTLPGGDTGGLAAAADDLPSGIGIYFRINPVPAALRRPAKDADVLRRRWLYVDVDPVKPDEFKDRCATDAEKAAAGEVCDAVNAHMLGLGWPAPVIVDSGNGYALLWRADLENDETARAACRRLLGTLAKQFSGPGGTIDKSVHNASRLVKLPGTWARKGPQSDDRPHRVCRIVNVPSELVPVTLGQVLAACADEKPQPERNGKHYEPPARNGEVADRTRAYGLKALDGECSRVAFATQRNNALNTAAFRLSQLMAGGVPLSEEEVVDRLTDAARQSGLDKDPGCGDRGIATTIASGLKGGREHPRRPEDKPEPKPFIGKQGVAERDQYVAEAKTGAKRLTVKMSQVESRRVDWLVPGRIPKRFITIMAGRTGVGKSFVSHDIIARLTTGGEIPGGGGQCFEPGGALVISEDPPEYIIAPRLIALGADLGRVNAMTWESMHHYHLGDTDMLGMACDEVEGGVSLVMIDPPTNFLDDVDEHKNSEVRQLVMKVVEWCAGRDVAVIFVLHVNKQTGKGVEALNRVMGSVAWVSTARIAHSFCLDPDDQTRGLWMPTKSNLGQMPKGLAYRITGGDTPGVEWLGEVDMTADEAMSAEPKSRKRCVVAAEWLVERFNEKPVWNSDDLIRAAKQAGVSRNALFEAKDALGLNKPRKHTYENGDVMWVWSIPADWPHRTPSTLETVGQLGHLESSDDE
jgi:hypothetical protein